MSNNNDEIIGKASPHTIKKFELVEKYIQTWAQKLMNNQYCNGVIFIDCMCNSGVYVDDSGETVYSTPIRVAKILRDVACQYPNKNVQLYFNDYANSRASSVKEIRAIIVISSSPNVWFLQSRHLQTSCIGRFPYPTHHYRL